MARKNLKVKPANIQGEEIETIHSDIEPKAPTLRLVDQKVVITPPNFATATVTIVGTGAGYMQNRFSSENRDKMEATQRAGSASKRTRKAKAPKDFDRVYRGSMHVAQAGWHGIPASALRNAMIEACRFTEMDMTRAKGCIFIVEQGLDKETLEPLVRIDGKPQMHIERVTIGMGQTDLAARALFVKWSSTFEVTWDDDIFKATDVVNLLARAGIQVGIGAGRPLSKKSAGTGRGTFKVDMR
jgi:hypothetical protein